MLSREILTGLRAKVGKFTYYAPVQQSQDILDSHLEALDKIDELEAELAEADKNLEYWANR